MEDLISKLGSVKLECNAIQVYSNSSHFKDFISSLLTHDFKKSMIENNKLGMNFITLFDYCDHDTVSISNTTYTCHILVNMESFQEALMEAFPPPFYIKYDRAGKRTYINVMW